MSVAGVRSDHRMLCVEDDELVARAIARVLRRCTVDHAPSIAKATSFLASRRYSGLIIDVGLPDGSGMEFLRRVRSERIVCPALIITGADPGPYVNEAHALSAELVTKPCPSVSVLLFEEGCTELPALKPVVRAHVDVLASEWKLSVRERDVIAAAARGVARAAIHLELGLKETTVRTYVTRLLAKADLTNLEEAVRMVLQSD